MVILPRELIEQVERAQALLFIGESVALDSQGRSILDQLKSKLLVRCGFSAVEDISFSGVAQEYEDVQSRHDLVQFVQEQFAELGDEPQLFHHLVAKLTVCNIFVTTCLDARLERAFRIAQRKLEVIVGNKDVAFGGETTPTLYRLRGRLEQPASLILTESDYERFYSHNTNISIALQAHLANKTIIFLGADLADPHFQNVYRKATEPLDNLARVSYACLPNPSHAIIRWCRRNNVRLLSVDPTEFLQALDQQLIARARAASEPARLDAPTTERRSTLPYKLLDYYEEQDAGIFFGRHEEIQRLVARIHAHRLNLIYGASGVGKTSLLLAGVVPMLESSNPPCATIYVRPLKDPAVVIRSTIRRLLEPAELAEDASLVHYIITATQQLGRTLIIVLDQFEEFFIRLSPQSRTAFINELSALVEAREVPVKIIISLREDWLAAVSEIEERIPQVFNVRLHLQPLRREQARLAITAPVEQLGVRYEPELVNRLLDDLVGELGADVMPPQLQLVCSALYDGLRPNEHVIELNAYERLGGTRGVLKRYLQDSLNRLGADDRTIARYVLQELVTSQNTKAVKTAAELELHFKGLALQGVLDKLVLARLLRVIEREDGARAYELAHEYLIQEIEVGSEGQRRKKAEELVRQELENWRNLNILIETNKLILISEAREVLVLSLEEQELLLRSALAEDFEIAEWCNAVHNVSLRLSVLTDVAQHGPAVQRQRVARVLGTHDQLPASELLLDLALRDPDASVRAVARASIAKLDLQYTTVISQLQQQLRHPDASIRRAVFETLSVLPTRSLPLQLQIQVFVTRARLILSRWRMRIIATPQGRTITWIVSVVLILLVPIYAFLINLYYLDIQATSIVSAPNTVVVRRGHPLIQIPGTGDVVVDTGIAVTQLNEEARQRISAGEIRGPWWTNTTMGYQRWGQEIAATLSFEERIKLLWVLNRDEGYAAILETLASSDADQQSFARRVISDLIVLDPDHSVELAQLLIERLATSAEDDPELMKLVETLKAALTKQAQTSDEIIQELAYLPANNQDTDAAYERAIDALTKAAQSEPEIAPLATQTLLEQLTDPRSERTDLCTSALTRITTADAATANLVIDALLPRLSDTNSLLQTRVGNTIVPIISRNPALATAARAQNLAGFINEANAESQVRTSAYVLHAALQESQAAMLPELTDQLVNQLSSPSAVVRASALYAIRPVVQAQPRILAPKIFTTLVQLLNDSDQVVRANAAYALEPIVRVEPERVSQQLTARLFEMLSDNNQDVRLHAVSALTPILQVDPTQFDADKVAKLLSLLKDSNPSIRWRATTLLGGTASQPVVAALNDRLNDQDASVRIAAIRSLSQIAQRGSAFTDPIQQTLIARLNNQDQAEREALIESIARIVQTTFRDGDATVERMFTVLDASDPELRSAAARALGTIALTTPGSEQIIIEALSKRLNDPELERTYVVSKELIRLTAKNPTIEKLVTTTLIEQLNDENSGLRAATADALAYMLPRVKNLASQELMSALAERLNDSDSKVRQSVCGAVAEALKLSPYLATSSTLEILIARQTDDDDGRGETATKALRQLLLIKPELISLVINKLDILLGDTNDAASTYTSLDEFADVTFSDALQDLSDEGGFSISYADQEIAVAAAGNKAAALLLTADIRRRLANATSEDASDFASILLLIIDTNPDLATPEMAHFFLQLTSDEHTQQIRKLAAIALNIMVRIDRNLATDQLRSELVLLLNSDNPSSQSIAALTLSQAVLANEQLATPTLGATLEPYIFDQAESVRTANSDALATLYARRMLKEGLVLDTLIERLTDPLNPSERQIASRALFLAALYDQTRLEPIKDRLRTLAQRREPHIRVAANRTMTMLNLAALAHTYEMQPENRDQVTQQLEQLDYYSWSTSLLDAELDWARNQAAEWTQRKPERGATP